MRDATLGPRLIARRKHLRTVPELRWGKGKDTTLCGALEAALRAAGEAREDLYDWLMGCSGAAFLARFEPGRWDPAVASPHQREVIERAARAGGVRPDRLEPPFDDELADLVWERIVEAVDASLPPLVRGLGRSAEFGLITGYDDDGQVLFARTYFEAEGESPRSTFDAFRGEHAPTVVFLDRAERPDDRALARDALRNAVEVSAPNETALAAWARALPEDPPAREAAARAFADWWMRTALADARRAASRFLRHIRTLLPERAGIEVLGAAERYGYVAGAVETGSFEAAVVTRFLDLSARRGLAHAVERALEHEREALGSLRRAVAALP